MKSIERNKSHGLTNTVDHESVQSVTQPSVTSLRTSAAKFNASVLRKLQKALEMDPEIDLATVLPAEYSGMLLSRKEDTRNIDYPEPDTADTKRKSRGAGNPGKSRILSKTGPLISLNLIGMEIVVHPLSKTLRDLAYSLRSIKATSVETFTTADVSNIIAQSIIIWQSETNPRRFVARCSPELIVKCVSSDKDHTEYTSLLYLEHHAPDLCVPRGHGLVICGEFAFLFMTYISGSTLSTVWPNLQLNAKEQICSDLENFFQKLRRLRKPADAPLGGVAHEGCKDTRRHTKISRRPIFNLEDFYEFLYGEARFGSIVYRNFLFGLSRHLEANAENCVFTHGDIHAENIIVCCADYSGACTLAGVVDWEMSGFYPESFECIKATNTLATNEDSDWFLNIPSSVSPKSWPARWLLDRLYDVHIA